MTDTDNNPTTTLPCPSWCGMPAGHHFHSINSDGMLVREHEGCEGSLLDVAIGLCATETAATDVGPASTGEVRVWVATDDTMSCQFTGPQVRQIAASLLNAADAWDRITEATS